MHFITLWFDLLKEWHYLGIIILMAMESSIFPVPSEVVIPPAAFWAARGEMNLYGVVLAGTFGSWLGSAVTYWLSAWLGRIVIVKWGRFALISEAKLQRAEHFVHRYEAGGIFFARLLPVIRHLISIPAGIIKMPFGVFSGMTIAGSLVWCSVLAWFGQRMALRNPEMINDPASMVASIKHESLPIVLFVVLFCVLYVAAMRLTQPKTARAA